MPGRAREHWLELQRDTLRGLKREIRRRLGRLPAPLRRYYEDYKSEFRRYRRLVTKEHLIAAVRMADIVFVGDYHTLKQSQKTNIKLLRDIVSERPRIVLCVESVLASQQRTLDRYQAGEMDDEEFLRTTDYAATWGFPWEPYRDLLAFAREHQLPVVALNSRPYDDLHRLRERDRFAAQRIADAVEAHAGALVSVVFGDLHIARGHLPRLTDEALARRGRRAKRVIVYQNSESLYWRLAARGLEHKADVLELAPDVYCVMNTPPWIKLQSFLSWSDRNLELLSRLPGVDGNGEIVTYSEEVYECADRIAEFLDLPHDGLHDVSVSTLDDLSFLSRLRGERSLGAIERLIVSGQSFHIAKLQTIYLPAPDLLSASEEVATFMASRGGFGYEFGGGETAFLSRVYYRAIGYFASKVINHKRKCPQLKDLRGMRDRTIRATVRERAIARAVLTMLPVLRRGGGATGDERRAIRRDPHLGFGVSTTLGHTIGDGLYRALIDGSVPRQTVASWFKSPPLSKLEMGERAATLWKAVRAVVSDADSKDDVF